MSACRRDGEALILHVMVKPRARVTAIKQITDNAVEIALAAPPIDGAANDALCVFVAQVLGTSKSRVQVERGTTSRHKVLRIEGVSGDGKQLLARALSREQAGRAPGS